MKNSKRINECIWQDTYIEVSVVRLVLVLGADFTLL